jgi:hypothetical protein
MDFVMIIETPYKAGDTVTIKTTGGDELVARFVEENDKTITVSKPLALMATQQGMGLAPFAFTVPVDSKIPLNKTAVLFIVKTEPQMAKSYITSTSGIQMI